MMSEYSEIQKPQLPYVHEFETDQLDSMSDCLAEHGFAVIKNVLNKKRRLVSCVRGAGARQIVKAEA